MSLWVLARATGAVTLLLLTLTVALGIVGRQRWAPRRTPRFVVEHLHRSTALLVVVLLVVHVTASVVDGYVQIRLVDAIVPFVGAYHPVWLGLGTLALDLLVALVVTSLLRARLGLRAWRAVHLLAYVCWPVAAVHGVGIGTDGGTTGWMLWLTLACAAVVVAAVAVRLTREPSAVAAPLAPTVPPAVTAPLAPTAPSAVAAPTAPTVPPAVTAPLAPTAPPTAWTPALRGTRPVVPDRRTLR
jgi:predicted ferric reductase